MRAAKRSVLDTLGCALHGSTLEWGRILREVVAAEGSAPEVPVWGTALAVSPAQAALVNATAGHSFELDDVHMGGMIHTGSLTVPTALAIGTRRGLDGRTLLAAVVAGCEVGARVGLAVGTAHFRTGFHPQGTAGVEAGVLHETLGIAGSQAAGLMAAQEGAMVKRLHSGRAAQSGVLSALLAERGFTGIPHVLEAGFGGFASAMGGGAPDLGQLTDGLGERWETEDIGFKLFASCAAAQTSLDVVRRLREQHELRPDDVAAVHVHASTHAAVHCGWDYVPAGITAAQMSIPYGVARMLLDGEVTAAGFTEETIGEPRAVELASRVAVIPDEDIDALGPMRRYTVRVEVETRGGRTVQGTAADRPGSPEFPLSDEQLTAKFLDLAAPVVGGVAAGRIVELVAELEGLDDTAQLTELLRRPS